MSLKIASELKVAVEQTLVATCRVVTATAKVAEHTVPQIAASTAYAINEAAMMAADALYDEEVHQRLDAKIAKFAGLDTNNNTN